MRQEGACARQGAHLRRRDGGGLRRGGLLRRGDGGRRRGAGARVAVLVRAARVADRAAQRLWRHLAERHPQALHDRVQALLGGDADGAQLVELLLGHVHAPLGVLDVRALLVGGAVHVLAALGLLEHDGARLEQARDLGLGGRLARLGQLDQLAHLQGGRASKEARKEGVHEPETTEAPPSAGRRAARARLDPTTAEQAAPPAPPWP